MLDKTTIAISQIMNDPKLSDQIRLGYKIATLRSGQRIVEFKYIGSDEVVELIVATGTVTVPAFITSEVYLEDWDDAEAGYPSEVAMWEQTVHEMCDKLWQLVYPGKTDWEYRDQPFVHLRQFLKEKDDEISRLKALIATGEKKDA